MKNSLSHFVLRLGVVFVMCSLLSYGCINTNTHFEPFKQTVLIDESYKLSLHYGFIHNSSSSNSNKIYELNFEESQGGTSYLFGVFKIKEHNGYDYKRLKVLDENSNTVLNLSINDLKEIGRDTVDLNLLL